MFRFLLNVCICCILCKSFKSGIKRNFNYALLRATNEDVSSLTQEGSAEKLEELMIKTKSYENEALSCLKTSVDSKEVEALRVLFLGKSGKITDMMKEMRSLNGKDKPKLGEIVNVAKTCVEEAIMEAKANVIVKEIEQQIENESIGLTGNIGSIPEFNYPAGSRHPLSLVLELTTKIFEDIGYEAVESSDDSPQVENDWNCFTALGMPEDHPARDMQDTFYIDKSNLDGNDENSLLRTHTSAVQIREMQKRTPPFKIVVPGRVYRKDDVDATHYPTFHQCEILAVDELGKLTLPHLLGTVKHFLRKMFGPEIDVKYRASYFPFTEPSIEVDVYFRGRWLEVLGCGMVDPVVLEAVGIDSTKYGGFAAGFGIERFAMIMHNIQDIRLFWENRLDFNKQFPSTAYGIPGECDEEMKEDQNSLGFDDYPEEIE